MAVLVTGATGLIGRCLTDALLARGASVRVVTRRPDRMPVEWNGRVEVVAGSLTESRILQSATNGVSLVFHLAAEVRDASSMRALNADVPKQFVRIAADAGVKRFVHLSSVGVMGAGGDNDITEHTPCHPKNEYERTKLDGERAVLEYAQSNGADIVVVRPTIVFGEGAGRSQDSMLEWMKAVVQGRFVFIGRQAVANYVYVGDVVEATLRLSERPSPGGDIFHIADPVPLRDFVGTMAEVLGVACPTRTIPTWVAYGVASLMDLANRAIGTPAPLTRSRVRALSSGCRFIGEKLRVQAGITLPFGYRIGLMRTVQGYRAAGNL